MSALEMEFIERILGIVIACVFAYILKPLIEAVIQKWQNNEMYNFVIKAIRSAEQDLSLEGNEEKKAKVYEKVAAYVSKHTKLELTAEEVDTIVEGSIKEAKEIYKKGKEEA